MMQRENALAQLSQGKGRMSQVTGFALSLGVVCRPSNDLVQSFSQRHDIVDGLPRSGHLLFPIQSKRNLFHPRHLLKTK